MVGVGDGPGVDVVAGVLVGLICSQNDHSSDLATTNLPWLVSCTTSTIHSHQPPCPGGSEGRQRPTFSAGLATV